MQADTDANILLFRFRGFFKNVFLHFYFAGRNLGSSKTYWTISSDFKMVRTGGKPSGPSRSKKLLKTLATGKY